MTTTVILGCGYIGRRLARHYLTQGSAVIGVTRSTESAAALGAEGIPALALDLARDLGPADLATVGLAGAQVFHLAPPPESGTLDLHTRRLVAAFDRLGHPSRVVYISTTGVYGDCRGARVDESRPCRPASARAQRRVAAEKHLRAFVRRHAKAAQRGAPPASSLSILRAPGIYAADRLSLDRLRRADPVLRREEDVYTNHIHADDLAHACVLAMFRAANGRSYNICDDAELRMGDYYDAMADAFGLPRPPRASREECAARLGPMTLSFMSESRRLSNRRARQELRWQPRWPDVVEALRTFGSTAPSSKEIA